MRDGWGWVAGHTFPRQHHVLKIASLWIADLPPSPLPLCIQGIALDTGCTTRSPTSLHDYAPHVFIYFRGVPSSPTNPQVQRILRWNCGLLYLI